jgi:hypothetical protein
VKKRLCSKTAKITFLMIAVSMVLSSCVQAQPRLENQNSIQVSKKEPVPVNATEAKSEASTPKEQELVKSLDDLYRSYRSLKILKNGENTAYDVSKSLGYLFGDLLSKVQEVDMSVQEEDKQLKEFDYNYYDYRLKFEGAADILFTLKRNVFHFEGEKQLYVLWGDSKPLWDNLTFDNKSNSADIREEKTKVMGKACEEDVDGDGKNENIELTYERGKSEDFKGDLTLSINASKTIVLKGEEWFTKPFRSIGEMPEIRFQQEQNGRNKAILVIFSWATNGVGSTGVINAYKYVNEHIREVKVEEAERIIQYKGKDMVSVSFPALQRTMSVKIDTDAFKRFLGEKDSLKQFLEVKDTFSSHPLWYPVKDYNGNGQAELCSVSILRWPPLALCRLLTYYKYENGKLKPAQVFVTSAYSDNEKKTYLTEAIFGLIHLNGFVTIGDKGIMDENFKPSYDYTPSEIKGSLEELQKDKILKLKGDRLYINY